MRRLLTALLALSFTAAHAIDRVPGTNTYYSARTDPITDVNTSFILIPEVNDLTDQTSYTIRCSNRDQAELWSYLSAKHALLADTELEYATKPVVTIRLGSDAPVVLRDQDVSIVSNASDDMDSAAIGFTAGPTRQIVAGLTAGKRLVVRINRASGGQALTYTFPATGVGTAWATIGACGTGRAGSAGPAPVTITPAPGAAAPKFTRWYFTTCTDATSGAVRAGLIAGRAHLCDLVIDTVPNGAQPVRAEFRYELEYREAGRTGKLTLDSVDRWPATGASGARYRQSGPQLIFTLPLNVRARPERVYTSINVTATVYFNNGTSKRVYEPLPVRPAN
ncbi:hypothetical protein [Deinococcus sp. RM]|uniref:hypothetical protein n=1 Tax=Deinococcus sp. RM TaxID=2316359 RepID=UPI000E68314A|nr:hypothetical protein [Deinococcus sp. RM]RIY05247.1 hypothetical protein D3W47_10300 [Deinococcus sp. RM]